MKNQIFTVAALSLCLFTVPSWAMDEGADISLNKAAKHTNAATRSNVATVEDSDDSSSSNSSSNESDNGQVEDKKSKKFFVYIADRWAATSYQHIVSGHGFSATHCKREHMKNMNPSRAEKFLDENRSIFRLCKIMKGALKKFGATHTFNTTVSRNRFIVELSTREEQSAKAVTGHCQKSDYVYKVFSDEAELHHYFAGPSTVSSSSLPLVQNLISAFETIGITMRPVDPNDAMFGVSAQTENRGHTEGNEDRSLGERDGAAPSSSMANPSPESEETDSSRTIWSRVFGHDEGYGSE